MNEKLRTKAIEKHHFTSLIKKNYLFYAANRDVAGLYTENRATMKKIFKIRRVYSGQAGIMFLLVFCLLTCSILASCHLRRLNLKEASSGTIEMRDSTSVKISFPYNRYSNEVLMY